MEQTRKRSGLMLKRMHKRPTYLMPMPFETEFKAKSKTSNTTVLATAKKKNFCSTKKIVHLKKC